MHLRAIAAIVCISAVFMTTTTLAAYAQQDRQMGASGDQVNADSPFVYNIPDSNVQVKVSWQPKTINTDEPTTFTFEFLDSNTGEHLQDVSYAVHMMLDGKSMGHGHEAKALEGMGTLEQQFDSMGSLSIIIDSITVGDAAIDGFAQINLAVVPEFPLVLVGIIMSIVVMGAAIASRLFSRKA